MDDDLNISGALSAIFYFMRDINKLLAEDKISGKNASEILFFMEKTDKVLGILEFEEEKVPEEIKKLAEKREESRRKKDFALSDKIREEMRQKGWQLDDTKDGVKVKRI